MFDLDFFKKELKHYTKGVDPGGPFFNPIPFSCSLDEATSFILMFAIPLKIFIYYP
jgi:hypothetical protein